MWSEQEQGGGFVDLYLAPFYFGYPDMRRAYLIELKYMNRSEDTPARRRKLLAEARQQLRRYAGNARVQQALGEAQLHALVLLYSGWELIRREAVEGATLNAPKKRRNRQGAREHQPDHDKKK